MSLKQVFLALGSNLGDRQKNLETALLALRNEPIRLIACSPIYETEPRDVTHQPWFFNMVVKCETALFPLQLLAIIHRVERSLGRTRVGVVPRGPRIIDIDILLFGSLVMQTEKLTIPHPRMLERRFVLEPLTEIASGLYYPGTHDLISRRLVGVSGQPMRRAGAVSPQLCLESES
jgi:2-amino-4-hydroxy-6-hydroxymethyldihydropteridine diphosphokinase